jgi:hypothetical protein
MLNIPFEELIENLKYSDPQFGPDGFAYDAACLAAAMLVVGTSADKLYKYTGQDRTFINVTLHRFKKFGVLDHRDQLVVNWDHLQEGLVCFYLDALVGAGSLVRFRQGEDFYYKSAN